MLHGLHEPAASRLFWYACASRCSLVYTIAPGLYHKHMLFAVGARLTPSVGGSHGVYGVPHVSWLDVNACREHQKARRLACVDCKRYNCYKG